METLFVGALGLVLAVLAFGFLKDYWWLALLLAASITAFNTKPLWLIFSAAPVIWVLAELAKTNKTLAPIADLVKFIMASILVLVGIGGFLSSLG